MNRLTLSALTAISLATFAQAHFLYASATPSSATVEFAEYPGNSRIANLAGKMDTAKVFHFDNSSSQPQSLKLEKFDEITTSKMNGGTVIAEIVYGVMDRSEGGRGIFRLDYFAKGTQSWAEASKSYNREFEIVIKKDASGVTATALANGKPVACEYAISHHGTGEITGVSKDGTFKVDTDKLIAIRATHAIQKSGTLEDKKYDLIRQYATLTAPAEANVPAGGDLTAWYLLKQAHDSREVLPNTVSSVSGKVRVIQDGLEGTGIFTFSFKDGLKLEWSGAQSLQDRCKQQLSSLIAHRRGRAFELGDGSNPVAFTGDENAVGKQVTLQDKSNSTYRVSGDVISEVRRNSNDGYFIISILDIAKTDYGTQLPRHFAVSNFDAKGNLRSVDAFRDEYEKVEGIYMPVYRSIISLTGEGAKTFTIYFSDIKIVEEVEED